MTAHAHPRKTCQACGYRAQDAGLGKGRFCRFCVSTARHSSAFRRSLALLTEALDRVSRLRRELRDHEDRGEGIRQELIAEKVAMETTK